MIFTMNQAELVWVCSCTTSFSPKNSDCREIRAARSRPTWQMDGTTIARGLPFNQSLRYLLRDRDAIFGQDFREQLRDMGIGAIHAAFALAESVCGAGDWIDSARVP